MSYYHNAISELLSQDGYIILSHTLVKKLGINKSVILSYLLTRYNYYRKEKKLTTDGMFFCTDIEISEYSGLAKNTYRNIINELKADGFIDTMLKGLPAKKYCKPNMEQIARLFQ